MRLLSLNLSSLLLSFLCPMLCGQEPCPYQELWNNGRLWAYSTCTCTYDGKTCTVTPSAAVYMYDGPVAVGCEVQGTECVCAESSRTPLDTVEADGETVAGAHSEYQLDPKRRLTWRPDRTAMRLPRNVVVEATDEQGNRVTKYYRCFEFRVRGHGENITYRVAVRLTEKDSVPAVSAEIEDGSVILRQNAFPILVDNRVKKRDDAR